MYLQLAKKLQIQALKYSRRKVNTLVLPFAARIAGRYTAEPVPGYVDADQLISPEIAQQIEDDEKDRKR